MRRRDLFAALLAPLALLIPRRKAVLDFETVGEPIAIDYRDFRPICEPIRIHDEILVDARDFAHLQRKNEKFARAYGGIFPYHSPTYQRVFDESTPLKKVDNTEMRRRMKICEDVGMTIVATKPCLAGKDPWHHAAT